MNSPTAARNGDGVDCPLRFRNSTNCRTDSRSSGINELIASARFSTAIGAFHPKYTAEPPALSNRYCPVATDSTAWQWLPGKHGFQPPRELNSALPASSAESQGIAVAVVPSPRSSASPIHFFFLRCRASCRDPRQTTYCPPHSQSPSPAGTLSGSIRSPLSIAGVTQFRCSSGVTLFWSIFSRPRAACNRYPK